MPRGYLRGFTSEYLRGPKGKGGVLAVYRAGNPAGRKLSLREVACELELYGGHPLDEHWSHTVEASWPKVLRWLKNAPGDSAPADDLLWFVSAQLLRTPSYMEVVSRAINVEGATVKEFDFEGRKAKTLLMGQAKTSDVLDRIEELWPKVKCDLKCSYRWRVARATAPPWFFTSDKPCLADATGTVILPLALDLCLIGDRIEEGALFVEQFRQRDVSADFVVRVNAFIVRACDSFVFAHEVSEQSGAFVARHYQRKDDPMQMGRSFKNDAVPMSDEEWQGIFERFEQMRKRERERGKAGNV